MLCGQPESREVLKEQADLAARDFGLIFLDECSAKIDKGINELFQVVIEKVHQQNM